jgi:arginyl-tRNA synthetase
LLRRAENPIPTFPKGEGAKAMQLLPKEKELIKLIHQFPAVLKEAGEAYSPALLANYIYELAKEYNQFYHDFPVLKEEDEAKKNFRLQLTILTGKVISDSLRLLGIQVPEKM